MRARPFAPLAAVFLMAICDCGAPRVERSPQVILYVDTDARLPHTSSPVSDSAPLFDRIRIEIFLPGGTEPCEQCKREFALDRETVDDSRASIGVPEVASTTGYRARLRLYLAASLDHGEPRPESTIDVTLALPAVADGEIVEATAFLPTERVARPWGTPLDPIAPRSGRPEPRSSTHRYKEPCTKPHDVGNESCVPGGRFWMGNPNITYTEDSSLGVDRQRLVHVSPFFVDLHEVTISDYRRFIDDRHLTTTPRPATSGVGQDDPHFACTWGKPDVLPVNCVAWAQARAYCNWRSRELPSEAQFEWLHGGTMGTQYIWGNDDPSCRDVIFRESDATIPPTRCAGEPRRPDSGERDAFFGWSLDVPIVDVVGNLSEWTLDAWDPQGGPCWGSGLFDNPICDHPARAGSRTVRGGSFRSTTSELRAALRRPMSETDDADTVGFRCVRPAN